MTRPKLVVGLTGGIGSGKTCATDVFERLGVPVIDADKIAREIVEPGSPGLEEIVSAFGAEVLDSQGKMRRDRMRQIVFDDPSAREKLEAVTHPLINKGINEKLESITYPYCIISSPLLLEAQSSLPIDRILVIDTSESLQKERASSRDGANESDIQKIMDSQMRRENRLKLADDVIVNDRDLQYLVDQVEFYHGSYLGMSE